MKNIFSIIFFKVYEYIQQTLLVYNNGAVAETAAG